MNETARELDMIRTQLRAAIERDLRDRSPRSRIMHRRSFRMAIPTVAVLAVATAAIVLALTVSAASPSSASAAAQCCRCGRMTPRPRGIPAICMRVSRKPSRPCAPLVPPLRYSTSPQTD